ncbi:MAG: FAD:protein FMN transferase, partial [Burkholderiales bacterium]
SEIDNGGNRIAPLVEPRRHACATWGESVSVVASNCMTADALTKVVRLAPEHVPEILARFNAQAIVLDGRGMRSCGAMLIEEGIAA